MKRRTELHGSQRKFSHELLLVLCYRYRYTFHKTRSSLQQQARIWISQYGLGLRPRSSQNRSILYVHVSLQHTLKKHCPNEAQVEQVLLPIIVGGNVRV